MSDKLDSSLVFQIQSLIFSMSKFVRDSAQGPHPRFQTHYNLEKQFTEFNVVTERGA